MQLWSPPVGLSAQEARFLSRLRNGKLYATQVLARHEAFDEATQQALMATCTARGSGKTSLAEAMLAAAGSIPQKGSVEKGTTVCDYDPIAKQFGHCT